MLYLDIDIAYHSFVYRNLKILAKISHLSCIIGKINSYLTVCDRNYHGRD